MSLRVAIAGLKGHYGVALQGLEQLPEARLVAASDDDPQKLAGVPKYQRADENTRVYADWREMLDKEQIDILVENGVDSERHQVVLSAADRKIHCLTEKPLANSLPDLADIRRALRRSGIHLSMLLTMRFEPQYRLLRSVIESGEIGEVCLAAAQKSYRLGVRPEWQKQKATYSGIIPFIGIHALDLIRWCTGREFTEVYACCANVGHPEMGEFEDEGHVVAKLDNGASASARLDYCRPAAAPTHGDDRLRVAGSKGVVESLWCGKQVTLITQDQAPRELELPAVGENQFVNFVRSIRGECACDVPAEDCLRMTEVVLKARASARRGIPYPV